MNIDNFSEQIRRKLESIRPDFKEDDWLRMQATLRQAGVPTPPPPKPTPPLGGATGLVAVGATITTLVLSVYILRQQHELDRLRQTITQQNPPAVVQPANPVQPGSPTADQATGSLRRAGRPAQPDQPARRPDNGANAAEPSVGLTNRPTPERVNRPADSPGPASERSTDAVTATRPGRELVQPRSGDATARVNRPISSSAGVPDGLEAAGAIRERRTTTSAPQPNRTNTPAERAVAAVESFRRAPSERSGDRAATTRRKTRSAVRSDATVDEQKRLNRSAGNVLDRPGNTNRPVPPNERPAPTAATATATALADPVSSRPLQLNATNWMERIARRIPRAELVRSTAPAPAAPVREPAKPAAEPKDVASRRVPGAVRFRIGAGGEVSPRLLSGGLAGEVLLSRHWAVSAGLSRTRLTGDMYRSDDDYNERYGGRPGPGPRSDFQRMYAPNLDPRGPIFDIRFAERRWQLPLGLTYRLPLNPSLTLLPTVGTTLNLSSQEWVDFSYRVPFYQAASDAHVLLNRGTPLTTSWYVGAGLEWQRGHWAAQGMPILVLPTHGTPPPGRADPTNAQVGLRLRLFYQF